MGLCVRGGRAGPGILRSKGPGPGAWLPPDPRFLGLRSPVLGYGIHAGECPPSNGLDPVRKEINKKGWEGGWGVRTAWAIQSRPRARAMEAGRIQAAPGQESESLSGWNPDIGAGEVLDDTLHLVVDLLKAVALHDGWGGGRVMGGKGENEPDEPDVWPGVATAQRKGHLFLILSALSHAVAPTQGGACF